MAKRLPKVCPFLVTVDLKLKWPELPRPTLYKQKSGKVEFMMRYNQEAIQHTIVRFCLAS